VADNGELAMSQLTHQRREVPGDRAFGLLTVVRQGLGLAGAAVAPHVGAHDGEACLHEARGHPVPGRPGSGMSVNEQDRRPLTPMPDSQKDLPDADDLVCEPLEHG
jgi:hypothetical protein